MSLVIISNLLSISKQNYISFKIITVIILVYVNVNIIFVT